MEIRYLSHIAITSDRTLRRQTPGTTHLRLILLALQLIFYTQFESRALSDTQAHTQQRYALHTSLGTIGFRKMEALLELFKALQSLEGFFHF